MGSHESSVNQWPWLYHDAVFFVYMYSFLCEHGYFHPEFEFSKKGIMEELSNKGFHIFTKFFEMIENRA